MARYVDTLLQRTLLRLLEEKPLDQITVTELCQEAEINRKTFYNHCASIPDLAFRLVEYQYDLLVGPALTQDSWAEALCRVLQAIRVNQTYVNRVYRTRCWDELSQRLQLKLSGTVAGLLRGARTQLEQAHGRPFRVSDRQMGYLVRYFTALTYSVVAEWYDGGMAEPEAATVQLMLALNSNGIWDGLCFFDRQGEAKG